MQIWQGNHNSITLITVTPISLQYGHSTQAFNAAQSLVLLVLGCYYTGGLKGLALPSTKCFTLIGTVSPTGYIEINV